MKSQLTGTYRKLTDEELIHRFIDKQDQHAVSGLFSRYGHLVFGICLRYTRNALAARQATEELFLKVLEQAPSQSGINFKSWLFGLTKSHCEVKFGSGRPMDSVMAASSFDSTGLKEEELQQRIEMLPKDEQQLLKLFYVEGADHRSIATKTGKSTDQVRMLLQKAMNRLTTSANKEEDRL